MNSLRSALARSASVAKSEFTARPILSFLKSANLLIVAAYLAAFLFITISRINYAYSLEWMEGTSVIQVHRILSGQLLYVEPSLDYIPLIYPPLYYYAAAIFAWLLGPGFLPLRLVSLLSTLGCMVLIYLIIGRLRPNVFAQLTAVGLFSATFKIGEAWFDVARVDMLALFLALASLYALQTSTQRRFALAAILMTLACLTKQSFVLLLIASVGYCFFLDRKSAWWFAITSLATYVGSFLVLNSVHGGWYKYFVYDLPYGHTAGLNIAGALQLFFESIFLPVGALFVMTIIHFTQTIRGDAAWPNFALVLPVAAILAISWLGLLNSGGFNNVLVPTHAILSIVAGVFMAGLLSSNSSSTFFQAGALLLIALQFALLRYPIADQIPTPADLAAGQALSRQIQAQPGDVYVPYHPELMLFAGKPTYADWIGMKELKGGFGGNAGSKEWLAVKVQLLAAIRRTKFSTILVDSPNFPGQPESHYRASEIVYPAADTFLPVAGWQIRPTILFLPAN